MEVKQASLFKIHPNFTQVKTVKNASVEKEIVEKGAKTINLLTGLACLAIMGAVLVTSKKVPPMVEGGVSESKSFSFQEFSRLIKELKITEPKDFYANCIEQNLIGTGANSKVYKFSDSRLKNWVIKVNTKHGGIENNIATSIQEIADEFIGVNMGQEIAKLGENVTILKRINGKPHSIENWSAHRSQSREITKEMTATFVDDVKKISDFSQETFDSYAKKLKLLDDKGYKADSFNPNNYLIDYNQREIHIIDAYKYDVDAHLNTKYDLICPLFDYPNFEKYYQIMDDLQKKEILSSIRKINEKCTIASEKVGVSSSEETFREFISRIDRREYGANKYLELFEKAKELCIDIL